MTGNHGFSAQQSASGAKILCSQVRYSPPSEGSAGMGTLVLRPDAEGVLRPGVQLPGLSMEATAAARLFTTLESH